MEKVLVGFGPNWRGVGLQHTWGLLGPSVNRCSIKRSPNGTKLDRRSTGSKPRPLGKSRTNPEMFNPHTRKKARNYHWRRTKRRNAKRTTGKMLECMIWTRMQMQCTWWHDMRCMTKKTTHGDKDPNPRNKYSLTPETARVGVQIGKVTSGVLHYHTRSSRGVSARRTLATVHTQREHLYFEI